MDVNDLHGLKKRFLKAGADDVVLLLDTQNSSQVKFSNNKVSVITNWDEGMLSVFVSAKNRLMSTNIKDLSEKTADKEVKRVMGILQVLPENKGYAGIFHGPAKYKKVEETYDQKIAGIGDGSIDLVEGVINDALANGAKRTAGILEMSETSSLLVTSNDVEAEEKGTRAYLSMRALVDEYASGHQVSNSRTLAGLKLKECPKQAAETAVLAKNPEAGSSGKFDVVFGSLPFANLLAEVGMASSAFHVESGLSCLAGKLNKKVAGENVSLHDDATMPNGFFSCSFDGEGVPTQKNTIINEGVLMTYLHNTSTAQRHKTKTTANAGIIVPKPFNLVLENGNLNKDEMISTVKKGLLVTNTWYTRFNNYEKGDFSTIPRDAIFLIEDGKIKKPVKHIRISDNLVRLLKNIEEAGKDASQVMGWENELPVFTPPVLVRKVNITRSTE